MKGAPLKRVPIDELKVIAGSHGLDLETIIKDYYLTSLLYTISKLDGLYFKGGTALYKIHLDNLRMSEDLDFTVKGNLKEIEKKVIATIENEQLFGKVTHDKRTEGYVRLIANYTSPYKKKDHVIIDLNARAKLLLPPEEREIKHFYQGYIPQFKINTLNLKELVAGKICALVQRYAARDYFDAYQIIKAKFPIDMELLEAKFKGAGEPFDIGRIFKRGNKVYARWNADILPLTANPPSFEEVMQTLAEFFRYKDYKASLNPTK